MVVNPFAGANVFVPPTGHARVATSSSIESLPGTPSSVASVKAEEPNTAPPTTRSAIVGPDGTVYTQGEAARLGMIIRAACRACRDRKLKCDGRNAEQGGCQRCEKAGIGCRYEARDPIGRPKKRKAEDAFSSHNGSHHLPRGASFDRPTTGSARSDVSSPNNHAFPSPSSFSLSASEATGINPAVFSSPNTETIASEASTAGPATSVAAMDFPSLNDLSVAAFLQSLDSLEITPPEGYLLQPDPSSSSALQNGGDGGEGWNVSGSAILDPNISYAVPADFSWWDIAGLGNELGLSNEAQNQAASTPTLNAARFAPLTIPASNFSTPTAPASPKWPRGREGGMGQGKLTTEDGTTYEARDWNGHDRGQGEEKLLARVWRNDVQDVTTSESCCNKDVPASEANGEAPIPACCNSGAKPAETSLPADKPCCSKKTQKDVASPAISAPAPVASTMPLSSSSNTADTADGKTQGKRKVFCVPNPNGKGCTCLCDMGVALISVRKTLRAAAVAAGEVVEQQPVQGVGTRDGPNSTASSAALPTKSKANATATLQLTLSASQAVATHCACSAECPTCRSDPSTQMTASLLVSTALQIYARAVKTLKEGVGGALGVMGGGKADLDVKIGEWKPSEANARKIALYAMKLELTDLRKALGKVSNMAKGSTNGDASGDSSARKSPLLNTIDQMVIDKLHAQLGEILETVIAE